MSLGESIAGRLTNYDTQSSLGSRLRARRIAPLLRMIETVATEHGSVELLDVGGTEQYWGVVPQEFLDRHKVKITVVNLPGSGMPPDHGRFTFREGDACNLAFIADKSYHIAHSNSVIEHVGDWVRMGQFAREIYRVADRSFVQTPNYWFPIEPHSLTPVIHWLPKPAQVWLISHFQLGNYPRATTINQAVLTVESARLLTRAMLRELFSESRIETERVIGFPKSFVAIKA